MDLRFRVCEWAAWAPGLDSRSQWLDWANTPARLPGGDDAPALAHVPALQRRRLSRLGRAVLQVVDQVPQGHADMPMVFASRYGDVDRALAAIGSLEDGEALSPTVFAGSVHNAIGAMHSIIGGHRQNIVCVAAGANTAAAGLIETGGLLADGADEVLLACYDEPLPVPYDTFAEAPQATYAWAWRVARPAAGEPALRLTRTARSAGNTDPAELPADLCVLRWFLDASPELLQGDGVSGWRWSRDA